MKREMPSPEEILAASERTGIDPEAIAGLKPWEACLICAWRSDQTISELAEVAGLSRGSVTTARSILRKKFPGILRTVSQVPDTSRARSRREKVVARIAALNDQISKGSSVREAMEILGIGARERAALKSYAARHGLSLPDRERFGPLTSKLLSLLRKGASVGEAAERIGMPLSDAETVVSRWRRTGVIRPDQGRDLTRQILAQWAKQEGLPLRQLKQKILREAAQVWEAKGGETP